MSLWNPNADIIVFGDTIVDILTVVKPVRLSQEDNYATVYQQVRYQEVFGGAANVVANLHALGTDVGFMSMRSPTDADPAREHCPPGYEVIHDRVRKHSYIPTQDQKPCVEIKHRILGEDGRYLMRIDWVPPEPGKPMAGYWQMENPGGCAVNEICKAKTKSQVLVVADYRKGFATPEFWQALSNGVARCSQKTCLLVDSRAYEWSTKLPRLPSWLALKMNLVEATRLCVAADDRELDFPAKPLTDRYGDIRIWQTQVMKTMQKVLNRIGQPCAFFVVTFGGYGIAAAAGQAAPRDQQDYIDTVESDPDSGMVDVCGAGDVVLAVLAREFSRGTFSSRTLAQGIRLANNAARRAVQRLGTCLVTKEDLGEKP